MSEPIDLDLVKLRATVRGWYIAEHANRIVIAPVVMDTTADILTYYRDGGTLVRDHMRTAHKLLTAPRCTLARLLSEPPEGWTAGGDGPYTAKLTWGERVSQRLRHHEVDFWVSRRTGVVEGVSVSATACGPEGLARLAERHKAAADLAYILAEIEP